MYVVHSQTMYGLIMDTTSSKANIVSELHSKLGCSVKDCQEIVETIFETVKATLEQGETVQLSGFGRFSIRSKKSRIGRNPSTGESVEITARKVLTFKPSKNLMEKVINGS